MKYFHPFNNLLIRRVCELINLVASGEKLTANELIQKMRDCGYCYDALPDGTRGSQKVTSGKSTMKADYDKFILDLLHEFFDLPVDLASQEPIHLYKNITDLETKYIFKTEDAPIPEIHTTVELQFLKALAKDEEYSFLLTEPLRKKLLELLSDIPDLILPNHWERVRFPGDDPRSEPLRTILQRLMKAFIGVESQKQQIIITKDGYSQQVYPYRLMHDLAYNTYTLLYWDPQYGKPPYGHTASPADPLRKISLSQLSDLQLAENEDHTPILVPDEFEGPWLKEDPIEDFFKVRSRFIRIQIDLSKLHLKDQENRFSRIFSLFEPYEKEARYIGQAESSNDWESTGRTGFIPTGQYEMKIHFYDFANEKEELISRLLSLIDSSVIVLKSVPGDSQDISTEIRNMMLEELKKMYILYRNSHSQFSNLHLDNI